MEEIKPFIVSAACRLLHQDKELIVTSPRHHDGIASSILTTLAVPRWVKKEQGFVDQYRKFYTREEAWIVALENNQIRRRVGGDMRVIDGIAIGRLYSENLY